MLKEQNGVIEEFDPWLWACMVDFVTVGRRKEMIFTFRDGTERGITEHKSGDRHSAPAGCFCVEWQSGIILIEMLFGQNMFMKTIIEADDGKVIPVLTMGPIGITPELKRKGYGKVLQIGRAHV